MILKIQEVTRKEKITYVGYSQGTSQMFYGLSKMEDRWYSNKLDKAIMLAPCIYTPTTGFEDYKEIFGTMKDLHINVISDANWKYDVENICANNDTACAFAMSMPENAQQDESLKREVLICPNNRLPPQCL